jgi:hypothetical protein
MTGGVSSADFAVLTSFRSSREFFAGGGMFFWSLLQALRQTVAVYDPVAIAPDR